MSELSDLSNPQAAVGRDTLLMYFCQLAEEASSLNELQEAIVRAIAERFSYCNWTGFYMLDPADKEMLVLGPFVGAPTPHVRIPVTEGICGAAVATGKTVIVDDVAADPRYLSCSIETKSEIVVPIYAHGAVVGEIDIDSHDPAAFTEVDRVFLEAVARIAGAYIEKNVEEKRAAELLGAQAKAEALFHEVEARGLIRPGITEGNLNAEIYALAEEMYGISTYWHKRIVRAGRNTLLPYAENPPDLMLGEDDILFLDLGPVFEQWEADFGRTFVLGSDPMKLKMKKDIEAAFAEGKQYFKEHTEITSSELFRYAESLAEKFGWEFGGPIAGHLIGQFPHEKIADDKVTLYIHPKSNLPMRSLNEKGQKRHWILEIHFVDRAREIGGFYEELLTV